MDTHFCERKWYISSRTICTWWLFIGNIFVVVYFYKTLSDDDDNDHDSNNDKNNNWAHLYGSISLATNSLKKLYILYFQACLVLETKINVTYTPPPNTQINSREHVGCEKLQGLSVLLLPLIHKDQRTVVIIANTVIGTDG